MVARASEVGRVGVLMNGVAANTAGQSYMQTFVQELSRLGWSEGRNLQLEMRWNAGEPSLARTYAADLVALRPARHTRIVDSEPRGTDRRDAHDSNCVR